MAFRALFAVSCVALTAAACSIYDTSLLESGGGGAPTSGPSSGGGPGSGGSPPQSTSTTTSSTTTSTSSTGGGGASTSTATSGGGGGAGTGGQGGTGGDGGTGGAPGCSTANQCPGTDTDCKKRSCTGGVCGFSFTSADTAVGAAGQTAGDCATTVCDGSGGTKKKPDDLDLPDDGKECTTDTCSAGAPQFTPLMSGDPCQSGTKYCDGAGACVECVADANCVTSHVCGADHKCAVATCTDGATNGAETDKDCGGPTCDACGVGKTCAMNRDCVTNVCTGTTCAACTGTHLLISEVRSRGVGGGNDDFVELYNPTSAAVVLDATWTLDARSDTAMDYNPTTPRWKGAGATIAPHGHFLIVGTGYSGPEKHDGSLSAGVTETASVRLRHSDVNVDVVCYAHTTFDFTGYDCEGAFATNPHGTTNTDASIERRPAGAPGNCVDTGDNATDFVTATPSTPQDTTSPATP